MEKTKHTPGPWTVESGSVFGHAGSARVALADRKEGLIRPVERDANVRLIAAAPDLLEACGQALKTIKTLKTFCDVSLTTVRAAEAEIIIEAAISKAEGQE